jgi:hypothetical protein
MDFKRIVQSMAQRLDAFPGEPARGQRRYPWEEWTDGSVWEIRRSEDYDVATENMRVNLHMRADSLSRKVRTHKFHDEHGQGLIFQFIDAKETKEARKPAGQHSDDTVALTELLFADALEIYERARREVTIERKDGRRQMYAPNRYRQQIQRAHAELRLVDAIGRIVRRPTQGLGHLENAGRRDLMLETLVLDTSKPYHRLFPTATVEAARERMAELVARQP